MAPGSLESELQISRPTVARYMRLLEEVFLIKRIPGWSRNLGTRATAAPKLIFVDSAIAARLLGLESHALRRPGAPSGSLLESFVLSELARQDFNGLRQLSTKVGEDFLVGIILYTGTATLPFGPKLRAVPVSALWQL